MSERAHGALTVDGRRLAPVPDPTEEATPVSASEGQLKDLWRPLPPPYVTSLPPSIPYSLTVEIDGKRRGVLPQGIVALLVAAGGAGKTYAAILFAVCAAVGGRWLGFDVTPAWSVLLLGETTAIELHRRIYNVCRQLQLTDEQLRLVLERVIALPLAGHSMTLVGAERGDGALPTTALCHELAELLDRQQAAMGDLPGHLILDGHARASSAESETSNHDATVSAQVYESLSGPGRNVWVLHHTPKAARREGIMDGNDAASASAARGVTALVDAARSAIVLEALKRVDDAPEIVVLRIAKFNDVAACPDVYLTRDQDFQGVLRTATQDELLAYKDALDGIKTARAEDRKGRAHEQILQKVVDLLRSAKEPLGVHKIRGETGGNIAAVAAALGDAEERGLVRRDYDGARCRGWAYAQPSEGILTNPHQPSPVSPSEPHHNRLRKGRLGEGHLAAGVAAEPGEGEATPAKGGQP